MTCKMAAPVTGTTLRTTGPNPADSRHFMAITYSKSMDQPGTAANPARGQLNRENEFSPVPVFA